MAERTLLINTLDVKQITNMGGNVDSDKYSEGVYYTQLSELVPIIGRPLYDKLIADVENSTLAGDYLTLVDDYIKYFLSWWAASDYALLSNYTMANGSTSTYTPDNGFSLDKDGVITLTERLEAKGKFYGQQMKTYLDDNKTLFPEYKGSSTNSNFRGWPTGDANTCWDG